MGTPKIRNGTQKILSIRQRLNPFLANPLCTNWIELSDNNCVAFEEGLKGLEWRKTFVFSLYIQCNAGIILGNFCLAASISCAWELYHESTRSYLVWSGYRCVQRRTMVSELSCHHGDVYFSVGWNSWRHFSSKYQNAEGCRTWTLSRSLSVLLSVDRRVQDSGTSLSRFHLCCVQKY